MHALEKEMKTHSSILAWRIPGMEEPGGLPSIGSHRVRHDLSDLAAAAGYKIYTQKSLAFLYTNNENQKEKLRNQSHSPVQQKELNI